METLEFTIYPDGRVQEKVQGVQGASCTEVTAAIEAQLGEVLNHDATSEYFSPLASQLSLHPSAVVAQSVFSEW